MATSTLLYDPARKYLLDGTIDLDTDTIKVALLASTYNPRPGAAAWVAATSYAVGTVIVSSGRYYECIVAGVSSGTQPFFSTTLGSTTTDNTISWLCWNYAPPSTHGVFADVSANEIVATGYVAGGVALTGKTVTQVVRTAYFMVDPASWASALIVARYAVIYKSGTANALTNPLLTYTLLDNTNIDVSVPVLANFSLAWPQGVFAF